MRFQSLCRISSFSNLVFVFSLPPALFSSSRVKSSSHLIVFFPALKSDFPYALPQSQFPTPCAVQHHPSNACISAALRSVLSKSLIKAEMSPPLLRNRRTSSFLVLQMFRTSNPPWTSFWGYYSETPRSVSLPTLSSWWFNSV